ncbi:ATP-grasp domain-containing protein [Rhodomicrobium lacus]|uniref:ATP-grasp domain-containing protein n=1 Tax=Rhodomicrobium lacus TaxID=2498452 RepID=UPI000F8E85E7|nr:ATP-grasp domain-containing protein [Rhodomicrobium lacus]
MAVDVALILGYDALGGVVPAIQAAKAAALTPIAILNRDGADYSGWLPDRQILRSANVNRDHRALADDIRQLGRFLEERRIRVRAILNGQDRMWLCYLDLRRAFPSAAGMPPSHIVKTSVKPNLRFLLRQTEHHVPYVLLPRRYVSSPDILRFPPLRALAERSGRLIVKPVVGSGGLGVTLVGNGDAFERNLGRAAEKALSLQRGMYGDRIAAPFLELASRRPVNDFVLVEAYIEGIEQSMEGFATPGGGIAYFVAQRKTRRVEEPVFRDLEYLVCNDHPTRQAVDCVSSLLRIVGFENSPFHIEVKGSGRYGMKPVEFNPRVGGGSIADLVASMHAINLHELGIRTVLDKVRVERSFVTVVVQPEKSGTVMSYRGLDKVQKQSDCVFIRKLVPEGSEIDRMDREAYLVEFCVSGKTAAAAQRRANELLGWIGVEIE